MFSEDGTLLEGTVIAASVNKKEVIKKSKNSTFNTHTFRFSGQIPVIVGAAKMATLRKQI